MGLNVKDRAENTIQAMIVIPNNDRRYNYYINGQPEKRSMLQRKMLEFCLNLCPDHAKKIRQSIFQLTPFIIYPEDNIFKALKEEDPPAINRRSLLLPMGKLVREDKIDFTKKENEVERIAKRFNVWEKYGIHLNNMKKAEYNKNKFLSIFSRI
jgi:hypothetical protein